MKRIIPMLLVAVFVIMSTMDAEAQRKRKRRTAEKERREDPFNKTGQLYHEIKFGNIFVNNGINLAAGYTVGFSINNFLSVNAGPRMRYTYFNGVGSNNFNLFDWSTIAGVRAKITETIYLQGDYGYFHTDLDYRSNDDLKKWAPLIGGGYITGEGPWKVGFEAKIHLDSELQDEYNLYEYWFSASYNF